MVAVSIEVTDGSVTAVAHGPGSVSRAMIVRTGDVDAPHVPIGTRSAASLRMVVDDEPVSLRPGRGRVTRGSYAVTAVRGTIRYELRPASPDMSRLLRDGVALGELSRVRDDLIEASWLAQAPIGPSDAATGHALAAAFGTGARFFLAALLEQGPDYVTG